ncbi:Holliday junction resolvase RuvX [Candidatus Peribacteria bacterium]|nr:Holliday junction resolvase RuvX [Candidatus Peribacteria bacterium]
MSHSDTALPYNASHTILAFDVGTRRTGCAVHHRGTGVAVALPTLTHATEVECLEGILSIVRSYNADIVVLGIPLLPSGQRGAQANFVEQIGNKLIENSVSLEYIDERYTTDRRSVSDKDAASACSILMTYIER